MDGQKGETHMSVMLILIFFSVTTAIIFLIAFIWAVKSGQFDDDYTPSVRILLDEPEPTPFQNSESINLKTENHATGKI
jgi:cbb3-type cytochrome oxidase maturation protein